MAELLIIPSLIMGAILGFLEIYFVHQDEPGVWFKHAFHALPTMFIFVFIGMNIHWAASIVGINLKETLTLDLIVRVILGIIATIKIAGAASLAGKLGVGFKIWHAFILGALVAASPYIWEIVSKFITI
ncbi:MAG: hypothetical protein ACP5OZ_04795 [Candidatus Woesearchaeota archaeon]